LTRAASEAPSQPEPAREPSEEQAARDRELLDFLIERFWAEMLRKLRTDT